MSNWILVTALAVQANLTNAAMNANETQVTRGPGGRILTNSGVWSPDGEWIVYDTRSDAAGATFEGRRIEMVNIHTREVRVLYESQNGAHCGVATFHPREWKVVFILGPEHPTPDWQYGFTHRQGAIVDASVPQASQSPAPHRPLDARDLTPPFTPGALRGGSHVHVWDASSTRVSFTYEDHVLARFQQPGPDHDLNQRNIGVSVAGLPVRVPRSHPRNQDGDYFTVLVTRTTAMPRPGSDDITSAVEEGWVGTNGYMRADGRRQRWALAFQGHVVAAKGDTMPEVFIVDLPEDLTQPGAGPLAGTETRMPSPPKDVAQRRLTFTADRKFPGLHGPRHWLRSAPDGSRIAFLMKDDAGVVQLWTASPQGGPPQQLTRNPQPIASAFSWSADGRWIGHVMDGSVCVTDTRTGATQRLTARSDEATAPRPEACVFSPDSRRLAYVRRLTENGVAANQVFVCEVR